MDLGLTGARILVAGSSRGIGRGIAESLLKEGAKVVLTGRDPEALKSTETELAGMYGASSLLAYSGDLAAPSTVEKLLAFISEKWGGPDHLVANVGSGRSLPGWDLPFEEWERAFSVNFWTGLRLVHAVLPGMVECRAGTITFISSIAGLESIGAPMAYGAAKAALTFHSTDLARQVGKYGVRVNAVAPGNILFPGGSWEGHLARDREGVEKMIAEKVPLQRFGTPGEVGDLVAFLISERAAFITGSILVADGGQSHR
jgi:3-oxoacyl-[acyl-carrier protein] reductase